MGWKRIGEKAYYYRKYREDGKVHSAYLSGELGRLWHASIQGNKRLLKLFRDFRRDSLADDKPVLELHREVDRMASVIMIAAGYWKPARHWRKIRDMSKLPAVRAKPPAPGVETERLFDRAHRGDRTCYHQVIALLEDPDRGPCLVHGLGSLANVTRAGLIDAIARKDIMLSEAMAARMEHMRKMLAGPSPSPLESLLAETITIDWLVLYRYQNRMVDITGLQIPQFEFWQKMIDRAHRRMMASTLTLARIRKCALPNLTQIIAQGGPQQVNVQGYP